MINGMQNGVSALDLIIGGDPALYAIISLSLIVSVSATLLAAAIGLPLGALRALLWDARFSLMTTVLAGFGRAAAEVGTVMIVGGNIDGFTRTMTTAIALETSKGDLPLAIGLGSVLIALIIAVNAAAGAARRLGELHAG